MADTAPIKYVFFDIVRFTEKRSVEAQADIVAAMNQIIRAALTASNAPDDRLILLPTGDGLCVAILNVEDPFDVHVVFALEALRLLEEYNTQQQDESRRFRVRVGVNANVDNVVTDINGRRNVAGAGINLAARVMSVADANQILVGQPVYEVLRHRERYTAAFRAYTATVKHGLRLPVYQMISDAAGLNTSTPVAFAAKPRSEPTFGKTAAYYVALAFRFVGELRVADTQAAVIWLWYRATDAEANETHYPDGRPDLKTYGAEKDLPIAKQIAYYSNLDFSVKWDLAESISAKHLDPFWDYFERGQYGMLWQRPLPKLRDKLAKEYPDIESKLSNFLVRVW